MSGSKEPYDSHDREDQREADELVHVHALH
jgi:hypothetical protein